MKPRRSPRLLVLLLVPWLGRAEETRSKPVRPGAAVSSHISEAIRARLPAFKPPPPAPPPDAAAAAEGGERPVILAPVVVMEKKAPTMGEFQMLTKEGQAAYLRKQFPGMVLPGGDPLTEAAPNYASQALRDKRRLEHLAKFGEAVETYRALGDQGGSKRLKEEMQRALIRSYDWRDERLDRSVNNDRR
ncbi:MAG: hypothetical protein NTV51_29800 [Verrucomicrobia bacterium]|nr:hypothetical protein [Verrucomicrobiota bacterium]